jgi:predicted nucleic acid-binding protein
MIVLDASVVLKWILGDEERGEKTKPYRDRHVSGEEVVAVHDLFFYEIANVLTTKTNLNTRDVLEAFALIWNFDFEIFNFGLEEFLAGITLSRRYRITLYDAAYISLAKRLQCSFVTADGRLYEKTKELKEVKLL